MASAPPGHRYRSLIWPGGLILLGVIALLVNTNIIPADRLDRLGDLWPLLLIVVGLELLISRSPMPTPAATVAGALVVVLAIVGAAAYVAIGPATPGGTQTLDRSERAGNLQFASVQIDVGAATLNVTGSGSLEGDLFRAHITYSGAAPDVSMDRSTGHVEISQSSRFQMFGSQKFHLDLQLNSQVRWNLVSNSGAATDTFKLASVKVGSIELNTGQSRDDITLGPPSGKVPIAINGGQLTVNLHRPSGSATDVNVSGGVISLDFDGRQQHGFGSLGVSTQDQADVYTVQINGGQCTVTVDTNSPSD